LHVKFEELYNEAAEIVDEIAERILVLENQPLQTMQDFVKASTLPAAQNIDDPLEAVTFAIQNIRTLIDQERTLVSVAEAYNDHGTISLLSEYVISQEKQVWMLGASASFLICLSRNSYANYTLLIITPTPRYN
jgi:starvation-inducible DNA-binding protein